MVRTFCITCIAALGLAAVFDDAAIQSVYAADEQFDLASGFKNPPDRAKPRAYWAWMNGNFSLPHLTRDLEEAADKGLSGLDIFDIGAKDPDGLIPAGPAFMGPASVEAIAHAVREASRLGLKIGLDYIQQLERRRAVGQTRTWRDGDFLFSNRYRRAR